MNSPSFLKAFDQHIQSKFAYLPLQISSMEVTELRHLLLIDSHLDSGMFNIICCTGDVDQKEVRKAISHFESKSLPFAFWVGFESEPLWLEDELIKMGLTTEEREWAMVCDLTAVELSSSSLEIKTVTDFAAIRDIITVINGILPEQEHKAIESFYREAANILLGQESQMTFFVGYSSKGEPIALSSLYYANGLASLFDVIVLPRERGHGIGKAMTLHAMQEAKNKGFDRCVLTATNDAKYLYQKVGFEEIKEMQVYSRALN